jgi:hypothetical protein
MLATRPADPPPLAVALSAPMCELLTWVARHPRTYTEAMDAWASHCPRFTVWEDALEANLVQIAGRAVVLTSAGQARLARHHAAQA